METTTDRQERSKSTGRGVHVTRKSYEFVPFEPGQDGGAREVWILHDGTRFCPLPPRLDLRNHSPSGFDWGGAGSGCAQLALAILADAADRTVAEELYQTFKNGVIAVMGTHPHPMFAETVRRWCAAVREGDPVRICSIEGQLLSEGAEA